MNNNQKIYLDEEGYEEYLKEIRELEKKLSQIKKEKNNAGRGKTHDGFHDNFDREQAARDQDMLNTLISQRKANMRNIVVISKRSEDGLVDLGDYVYVEVSSDENEIQGRLIKLTGALMPKTADEVHELTINSPIGKAIYKKSVGETVFYKVRGKEFKVVIKGRTKTLNELIDNKKNIRR